MASDNKGKKTAEAAAGKQEPPSRPKKEKKIRNPNPNYRYNVNHCDCCKITDKDLTVLNSEWRAVVLCKSCFSLIDSADLCSYCFNPFHQEVDKTHEIPILTCHSCFHRIHYGCLHINHPFYVPDQPVVPGSFTCVDCNACPATPNLLKNPSYKQSDLIKKKEEEKSSKSSPRKSRKLLKEEKNVEGSSSAGRSLSGKMKVVPNIPADHVDAIDRWEWEKFEKAHTDQGGSPGHPNRRYYRCQNFSSGCLVEKHVEESLNNQQMFDVMYTGHNMHNHRLPGHRGSTTSEMTSLSPKPKERAAKGSSSTSNKSSSPPKSPKRPGKGPKPSSPTKSAEKPL